MNRVGRLWDRVFGNRDGRFDMRDIPKSAPAIVALVVDIIMLIVEYRVFDVGLHLTSNALIALGFVGVSSIPFYLGQLAYLYNRANRRQQGLAGLLVLMGLGVSAYLGFADLTIRVNGTDYPLGDTNAVFAVVISATTLLIIGGLLYVLVDDQIAMRLRETRMRAQFNSARQEIQMMGQLAQEGKSLMQLEDELRQKYGNDFIDDLMNQYRNRRRKDDEAPPEGKIQASGSHSIPAEPPFLPREGPDRAPRPDPIPPRRQS